MEPQPNQLLEIDLDSKEHIESLLVYWERRRVLALQTSSRQRPFNAVWHFPSNTFWRLHEAKAGNLIPGQVIRAVLGYYGPESLHTVQEAINRRRSAGV